METLKHPACTVGWVACLCGSCLSPGKATQISHGINPTRTMQLIWNVNHPQGMTEPRLTVCGKDEEGRSSEALQRVEVSVPALHLHVFVVHHRHCQLQHQQHGTLKPFHGMLQQFLWSTQTSQPLHHTDTVPWDTETRCGTPNQCDGTLLQYDGTQTRYHYDTEITPYYSKTISEDNVTII